MALSFVQYTANGSTDTFNIPFPYLSKTHIQVKVNGVLDATVTFPTDSTVKTTTMPPSGAIVEVRRVTPNTLRLVDFADGSLLGEGDLDKSALQVFYVMQELYDDLANKLGINSTNAFDAQNKKIINLAPATDPQDATNKQYVDAAIGTWAPKDATYLTLSANASLISERILTPGTGLTGNDGGAGSPYTLSLSIPVLPAHGGTGLTAIGTANQMLGVNNAANGLEYKTFNAGSGINISHGAGSVTINSTITQYTDEIAQDAVGGILSDTATIDATYDDSGGNISFDLKDNSVSNAKLRDSTGLSVIGRSANSTGDPADITAGSDGGVLRRSGTTLGFGNIPSSSVTGLGALAAKNTAGTSDIDNDAVTYAKMQNVTSSRLLGRSTAGAGDTEEIIIGTGLSLSGGELSATGGGGGGGAPTDATYITQTPNGGLSNEQALSSLSSGIVKVTTGTGILSSVTAPTGAVVGTTDTQTLTNKTVIEKGVALTDGPTINTDAALGNIFTVTLGGNRTMANPSNPTDGQKITYRIKQDTTGHRTLTWGNAFASFDPLMDSFFYNSNYAFLTGQYDITDYSYLSDLREGQPPGTVNIYEFQYNAAQGQWEPISVKKDLFRIIGSLLTAPGTTATVDSLNDFSGTVDWTNPNNVLTSNDVNATVTLAADETSYHLKTYNYSFGLPTNANAVTAEMTIELKADAACEVQVAAYVLQDATDDETYYSEFSNADNGILSLTTSDQTFTLTLDWPLFTSYQWASETEFGVSLAVTNITPSTRTISIDQIKMKVYYTDPN